MRLKRIWRHLTRACLNCGRRPARVGRCHQCFVLETKDIAKQMMEALVAAAVRGRALPAGEDPFQTFKAEAFVVKDAQTGDMVKEGELQ